jgi:hypothetical protein
MAKKANVISGFDDEFCPRSLPRNASIRSHALGCVFFGFFAQTL